MNKDGKKIKIAGKYFPVMRLFFFLFAVKR